MKTVFGGVRELNCVRGGEWSGFVSTGPRTVGAVGGVCGVGAVVCVLVGGVVGGGWLFMMGEELVDAFDDWGGQ